MSHIEQPGKKSMFSCKWFTRKSHIFTALEKYEDFL